MQHPGFLSQALLLLGPLRSASLHFLQVSVEFRNTVIEFCLLLLETADDLACLLNLFQALASLVLSSLPSRHELVDLAFQVLLVLQRALKLLDKFSLAVLETTEDFLFVKGELAFTFKSLLDALHLGLSPPALLFNVQTSLLFSDHPLLQLLDLFLAFLNFL